MLFGLALYALEALQSIALIPFFKHMLGASEASYWVAVTTSVGLVGLTYAGYYQPLVRNLSTVRGDAETAEVPANWEAVARRVAFIGAAFLLGTQALFCWLVLGSNGNSLHGLWAALLYFVAMHLRLGAFNRFILLNGFRQVGRDKMMLIVASATNLLLMLLFGSYFKHALALAVASIAANIVLYALARGAASRLAASHPRATWNVSMPRWREILGLIMLSLGGYLNLSTDVLLSARLLHPEQALDYAFWSRLLFTQWALVGLAVQVRYPFWASPSLSFSAVLAEIRKAYWPLLLGSAALLLAYLVNRQMQFIGHGALLPLWMFAVMALNAYVCCITSLLGQTLIVRNVYSFVRPSIAISCCSPLAALAIGHLVSPQSFVVGYLLANLLLFAVVFKASRDHLRSQ